VRGGSTPSGACSRFSCAAVCASTVVGRKNFAGCKSVRGTEVAARERQARPRRAAQLSASSGRGRAARARAAAAARAPRADPLVMSPAQGTHFSHRRAHAAGLVRCAESR
jgi:glycine/serine hydroxymethyltransferase